MDTYSPNQCPHKVTTSYTLQNPRNNPDRILKLMVNTTRSKVKQRSHQDLQHLRHVPTKYQLPTLYNFRDIARKNLKVKVSTARSKVKSRPYYDVTHLQSQPMSLPSINFLHLTVAEIMPIQDIIGQGHYSKVKGQIKVTP